MQRVTDSGYINFLPVGGWWAHSLLAQRVEVVTEHGKVSGVIGSIPPHLLGAGSPEKVMEISKRFIDIGAETGNQAAEEFGVQPGCPIVPYGPFMGLDWTPRHFGGRRMWGICAGCEGRTGAEQFRCRECYRLVHCQALFVVFSN